MGQVTIKIWIENSVSAIKHLGNDKKSCFGVLFRIAQANRVAYSCSFTLHTSYTIGMLDQWGRLSKG